MADPMSHEEVRAAWEELIREIRAGVLLTLRHGRPFGSHVPFLLGEDWTRVYVHLSRLALHTQHLLADPRLSLFLSEPDSPQKNPLALKRMNLQGLGVILPPEEPKYARAKERYLARFPAASAMFTFADFNLWELRMEEAHLVLGFGQAYLSSAATPHEWTHQRPETPFRR
jgi:putative heme iron utilization protein